MNLDYQRAGRVLPFPFHFLNNNHAMNVRPKNYTWPEFYDGLIDVTSYSFSLAGHRAADSGDADGDPEVDERGAGGVVGGVGPDPVPHRRSGALLDTDRSVRAYMEGETTVLPEFYLEPDPPASSGPMYEYLPGRARWRTIPNAVPRRRQVERARDAGARSGARRGRLTGTASAVREPGPHVDPRADPLLPSAKVEVLLRAISRSPCGVAGAVRCQSSSCWPMAEAGIQTPGLDAGIERGVLGLEPGFADGALHAVPPT